MIRPIALRAAAHRRLALLLAVAIVGCGLPRTLMAASRSTDQFKQSPDDPRVFFEPGAEPMAHAAAGAIAHAVETVEQRQFRPFAIPVRVYVCASLDSLASHTAAPRAGGHTLNHRVFISPKPENTLERMPRLLTHELSHLQIAQSRSLWNELPPWFAEGLATYVSDGGGAEDVTDAEARDAIAHGHAFVPEDGHLWNRKYGDAYGLSAHLFYREAALFIASLDERNPSAFKAFLLSIEDGGNVGSSLRAAYGIDVQDAWRQFVASTSAAR